MKRFLIAFAGLLALLLIGALIAPSFINWNKYRPEIARRIEAETGRKVAIDGSLSFTLLPTPALSVERVSLANLPGASQPQMISLKSMQVRVALLPLLGGRIQVDRLRLVQPVISLEVLPGGRRNWDFEAKSTATGRAVAAGLAKPAPGASANVSLDSVQIADGTLNYRDAAGNIHERLENIDSSLRVGALNGPFTASGSLLFHSAVLRFELALGRIVAGAPAELGGSIEIPAAKAKLRFSGQVSDPLTAPKLTGRLRCSTDSIGALAAALQAGVNAVARPGSMEARFSVNAHELALNDVRLQLADTSASGQLNLALGAQPKLDATLKVNLLDLGALLSSASPTAVTGGGSPAAPGTAPLPAGTGLRLPPTLRGNLNLTIAALAWRGSVVRQVQLAAAFDAGSVQVSKLTALLPGGAEAELSGNLAAAGGSPRFDGKIRAEADNLRAVLDWLKVDVARVPVDRLLKFRASSLLALTPDLLQIANLDATIDSSRVVGAVNIALRSRPSFGAKLDIDRINLQAYMPAAAASPPDANPTVPSTAEQLIGPSKPGGGPPPFGWLAKFDTIALVHVGELTWNQVPVRDLSFNVKLVGGQLAVSQLRMADAGGADIALSGTARGLAGSPSYDFKASLQAQSLAGVARLLGTALPAALAQTKGVSFQANIAGAPGTIELHGFKLKLGATDLTGDVTARFDGDRPKISAKLNGSDVLLDQLLPVAATPAAIGPIDNHIATPGPAAPGTAGSAPNSGHWSDELFDISALTLLDAEIALKARYLAYQGHGLADPDLALTLDNGVLELRQLQGKLFGGNLNATGRLIATGVPSFTLQISLVDGDLLQALSRLLGIRAISGQFALKGEFSSQGRSELDLVQHLAGNAVVNARNGVVRGIELKTLSDQLKQLKNIGDFANLQNLALSAGETRLASASGSWSVKQGIARTQDSTAMLDAATASLAGLVDLPAWAMDLKSSYKLTGHPEAPALRIDLSGPLDHPQRELKVDDLRRFLLQGFGSRPLKGGIGNALQQAIGGTTAPTNPAGAPNRAAANGLPGGK